MIPRTIFSQEHAELRTAVRQFIGHEITPHYLDWEKAGIVPREIWLKAGAFGLLCPALPTEYGWLGASFLHSVVLTEEMARVGAMAPTFYLQSDIVAPYILHLGTDEQKRYWLPRMATGEVVAAVGNVGTVRRQRPAGHQDGSHPRGRRIRH